MVVHNPDKVVVVGSIPTKRTIFNIRNTMLVLAVIGAITTVGAVVMLVITFLTLRKK